MNITWKIKRYFNEIENIDKGNIFFAQLLKKQVSPERLDALTAISFLVTKYQDIRDISRMILSQVVW